MSASVLLLIVLASLPIRASAQARSDVVIDVTGPLVIGFFPPFTKTEESEDGVIEGLAHMRFALDDIAECIADTSTTYRLDVTRSIVLRDGKRVQRVTLPRDWGHAVGIILVAPGRSRRTVFAPEGPSTLIQLGPAAAAEYFGKPACRRE
jgi:hypothetical protein